MRGCTRYRRCRVHCDLRVVQTEKQMSTAEILANREYKYGWVTDIESEMIPRGLSEDTVRLISAKKDEPDWMLEFRLKAYRNWLTMKEPRKWPNIEFPEVN